MAAGYLLPGAEDATPNNTVERIKEVAMRVYSITHMQLGDNASEVVQRSKNVFHVLLIIT